MKNTNVVVALLVSFVLGLTLVFVAFGYSNNGRMGMMMGDNGMMDDSMSHDMDDECHEHMEEHEGMDRMMDEHMEEDEEMHHMMHDHMEDTCDQNT